MTSLEGVSAQMNNLEIVPSSRSQSLESHVASEALHSRRNTAASDRSLSNDAEDVAGRTYNFAHGRTSTLTLPCYRCDLLACSCP